MMIEDQNSDTGGTSKRYEVVKFDQTQKSQLRVVEERIET